jgi:hypothetical protein
MSKNNGAKEYLFVIRHVRWMRVDDPLTKRIKGEYIVRSDHDPKPEELCDLLGLNYDPNKDDLDMQRYDPDALPSLPKKK